MAVLSHGEPVTVTRPSWDTDRYGNQAPDWTATTVTTYQHCVAYPGTAEESTDGRVTGSMSELTLLLPYGADVAPSDRVSWRGRSFEVVSPTYDYRSPLTGWEPGTAVTIRAYEG